MRRFAYRLAAHLGHANVDRMLRGMTSRQMMEWVAFDQLEPFGPQRADARSASIVATLININRKRDVSPVKLEDCLLAFDDEGVRAAKKKQSWREQKAIAQMFFEGKT